MLSAARWWIDASRIIYQAKLDSGIVIPEADSAQTGLIGVEYTPITTTLGSLKSKQISANPDFAALMVRWLWSEGIDEGDTVAVALSGSFPALNLAVQAAVEVLDLHAVITLSLGASSWGANQPEMTWLDMAALLKKKGKITHDVDMVTLGGSGDHGGGIPDVGIEILRQNIEDSGIDFPDPQSLEQAVGIRLVRYGNLSQYKCFINVGGGHAVLGRGPGGRTLPTGLLTRFPKDGPFEAGEVDGVIFYFLRQRVPVIHMLEIHQIAKDWGIPTNPKRFSSSGHSDVYFLPD
jgi:poly-gamma-glutamate system protein